MFVYTHGGKILMQNLGQILFSRIKDTFVFAYYDLVIVYIFSLDLKYFCADETAINNLLLKFVSECRLFCHNLIHICLCDFNLIPRILSRKIW